MPGAKTLPGISTGWLKVTMVRLSHSSAFATGAQANPAKINDGSQSCFVILMPLSLNSRISSDALKRDPAPVGFCLFTRILGALIPCLRDHWRDWLVLW